MHSQLKRQAQGSFLGNFSVCKELLLCDERMNNRH